MNGRPTAVGLGLTAVIALAAACTSGGSERPFDTDDSDLPEPELLGIVLSPERITLPLGEDVQLQATGLRADRSTEDLTFAVTWHSEDEAIAEPSNRLDAEGLVTGRGIGQTHVWATLDGLRSIDARVTVTEAELLGLTARPSPIVLERGRSVQLTAEAAFSDGTRSDASGQVLWVTGDAAVATLERGGNLTGVQSGQTAVHALWGDVRSPDVPVQVQAQALPDLRFASVTGEVAGGVLDLRATLENAGPVGASEFWVDLFLDVEGVPGPGSIGEDFRRIAWIGAEQSTVVRFQIPLSESSHRVVLVADIEREVDESDQSNNSFAQTYANDGGAGGPNLTVPYFDYVSDADDDLVLYGVQVENTGTESVGEFWVDIWYDDATDPTASGLGDDFVRVEGLDPGESASADFFVSAFSVEAGCARCTSWIMVDTNEEVDETNEADNVSGPLDVILD